MGERLAWGGYVQQQTTITQLFPHQN